MTVVIEIDDDDVSDALAWCLARFGPIARDDKTWSFSRFESRAVFKFEPSKFWHETALSEFKDRWKGHEYPYLVTITESLETYLPNFAIFASWLDQNYPNKWLVDGVSNWSGFSRSFRFQTETAAITFKLKFG